MKTRSNRTFVVLTLAMLVTCVVGLTLVAVLIKAQLDIHVKPVDLTAEAENGNFYNYLDVVALLQGTQTSAAALTLMQTANPSVPTGETTAAATKTATPVAQPCALSWARQDLPDVTTSAQQALNDAGVKDGIVRAEAYGESCADATGKAGSFAAMTTDFYVTMKVNDLSDDTLAEQALKLYNALVQVPTSILPASLGYLDITLNTATDSQHLRAMFPSIRAALEKGLTGKALVAIFTN